MRSFTVLLFLLCFIVLSNCSNSNEELRSSLHSIQVDRTVGQPWPLPQTMNTTNQQFAIHPEAFHFLVNQSSQTCDLLTSALDRYYQLTFFPHVHWIVIINWHSFRTHISIIYFILNWSINKSKYWNWKRS